MHLAFKISSASSSSSSSSSTALNVSSLATSTHALLPTFPEESWVQDWIRIRLDGKKRKSCGFKNIRILVDRALAVSNPQIYKSTAYLAPYKGIACDGIHRCPPKSWPKPETTHGKSLAPRVRNPNLVPRASVTFVQLVIPVAVQKDRERDWGNPKQFSILDTTP